MRMLIKRLIKLLNLIDNGEIMKEKQAKLIEMVSNFCKDKLDDECRQLCVKLIEKMGRKREVSFKRGKLEIWASGVAYAICQINFIFDESFKPFTTPDEICEYFNTKKSTTSNKASDIRKLMKIKIGDEEFSTRLVLNSNVKGTNINETKSLKIAQNMNMIKNAANILKVIHNSRKF